MDLSDGTLAEPLELAATTDAEELDAGVKSAADAADAAAAAAEGDTASDVGDIMTQEEREELAAFFKAKDGSVAGSVTHSVSTIAFSSDEDEDADAEPPAPAGLSVGESSALAARSRRAAFKSWADATTAAESVKATATATQRGASNTTSSTKWLVEEAAARAVRANALALPLAEAAGGAHLVAEAASDAVHDAVRNFALVSKQARRLEDEGDATAAQAAWKAAWASQASAQAAAQVAERAAALASEHAAAVEALDVEAAEADSLGFSARLYGASGVSVSAFLKTEEIGPQARVEMMFALSCPARPRPCTCPSSLPTQDKGSGAEGPKAKGGFFARAARKAAAKVLRVCGDVARNFSKMVRGVCKLARRALLTGQGR